MSHWTIAQPIVLDIALDYTMVRFPTWLLNMDMRDNDAAQFVYARRHFVTMAEMGHGLATLNSNYFVVYDQKQKVWVLVLLVKKNEHFETNIEKIR